jgi:hypothetical protein
MSAERIEEMLSTPDPEQVFQGLFLLESLEDPEILASVASAVSSMGLLHALDFSLDISPSWGNSLGPHRALAQLRVLQLLARHVPDQPDTAYQREVLIQKRGPSAVVASHIVQFPNGKQLTLRAGPECADIASALDSIDASTLPLGTAPLSLVVRLLGEQLLSGAFPRVRLTIRLLQSVIRDFLATPGPWELSMQGLPDETVAMENLSRLRLEGSKVTTLPPRGPATLRVEAAYCPLASLPGWVRRVGLDGGQWSRWRGQLSAVTELAINSHEPIEMAGAQLPALSSLRLWALDLSEPLAWLRARRRPLQMLWLGSPDWQVPGWLWSHPVTELRLEGARLDLSTLPAQPPPTLSRLYLPPDQLRLLPAAWSHARVLPVGRRVYLLSWGERKIGCIKLVRQYTNLGLREAKDLVESAPCTILIAQSAAAAVEIQQVFRESGSTIELRSL